MQIKTTMKYHLTPDRMANTKRIFLKKKFWYACEERETQMM
jgi:hypothetical protein